MPAASLWEGYRMTGQLRKALKARQKARREFEKASRILQDVLNREMRGEAVEKEVEAALLAVIEAGNRMERARQRR